MSRETYEDLYRASVEACEAIYRSARSWREDGEEWKRDLTMLDVARVFEALETVLDGSGMGVRIAV